MKLRIKELREEAGLTQKELAEKIGNMQRNISNWENGLSEPDCETILRICDFFGVSTDELFGYNATEKTVSDNTEKPIYRAVHALTEKQKVALLALLQSFGQ